MAAKETGGAGSDNSSPLAVAAQALDLQDLDAPAREQLTRQLLTLREALRSGELDEQEALETLEGLLQDQGLALSNELKQLWQSLAGSPAAEGEQQPSPMLALLDGLRQLLADTGLKQDTGQKRGDSAVAGEAMGLAVAGADANREDSLRTDGELAGRKVSSNAETEHQSPQQRETAAERRVANWLSTATGEAAAGGEKPGLALKESAAALKETEVVLKNVALGEGDARVRNATDRALFSLALSGEKGSAIPTGLQPPAGSTAAAAPIPTERGFTVQTMVNTLVGQPNWGQAVGQRVMWLAQQNIAEAQLRLDPPDLGPVKVKISVQNEQAQVVFTSHSPGVREALDQSTQRLRELFAEQGLDLVNVDVSDDQRGGAGDGTPEESGPFAGRGVDTDPDGTEPPQWVMEGQLTLVDHYA